MKLEDRLRYALRGIADFVDPPNDAWERLQRAMQFGSRPRASGNRIAVMLLAMSLALAAIVFSWNVFGAARDRPSQQPDESGARVAGVVDLPLTPKRLAVANGTVWMISGDIEPVTDCTGGYFSYESRTGKVSTPQATGGVPSAILAAEGSIWIGQQACLDGAILPTGEILRLDAATGEVLARIPVPLEGRPSSLAYGHGYVWATWSQSAETVVVIDPSINAVKSLIPVAGRLRDIAVGDGVWVLDTDPYDGGVIAISPGSERIVGDARLGPNPAGLVADAGTVWTSTPDGLIGLDTSAAVVEKIETETLHGTPAARDKAGIWVIELTSEGGHRLAHLERASGRVDFRLDLPVLALRGTVDEAVDTLWLLSPGPKLIEVHLDMGGA